MKMIALACLALCPLLSGCGKNAKPPEPPTRPVITHTIQPALSEIVRRFSGQVLAAQGTAIGFEVTGRVIEVTAKAGERYEEGTPLARIDDVNFSNQLTASKAQFTNVRQELNRIRSLFESGNASQSQLETAIAQEQSASAELKRAEKSVSDCILTMPYPGVIARVDIEPQQLISMGQPALTIQGDSGLEFQIGVPASDVAALVTGMKAKVTLGAFPDHFFPASVSEIAPEVAQNTTYPVTLTLVDDRQAGASILPGLDGEAALSLPDPSGSVLRVPAASVAAAPDGSNFVWIITKKSERLGEVTRRAVKTAGLAPDGMVAISEGVTPGEVVVRRGVHSLKENMTVQLGE